MKILQITTTGQSGVATWILNKGPELAKRGVQFDVLYFGVLDQHFKDSVAAWGGKVIHFPMALYTDEQVVSAFLNLGLDSYDVYHFQGMYHRYVRLKNLLEGLNLPGLFLAHAHNIQGPYSKVFDYSDMEGTSAMDEFYSYAQWVDAYMGCGYEVCRSWYGQDLADEEFLILTNSLDTVAYAKSEEERAFIKHQLRLYYAIPEGHKVLGFVGRVSPGKNLELIAEMAEKSQAAGDPLTYVIVGTGEVTQAVEKHVAERGLDNVRLLFEWRDDIPDLLAFFDGLLLPSLFEGVPNVVVEAQAAGITSFVSSRVSDECDLGLGLVDYLTIESEDVVDLWRHAILDRLANPVLVSPEERLARFVATGYDNAPSAQFYLDAMTQLLEKKKENTRN